MSERTPGEKLNGCLILPREGMANAIAHMSNEKRATVLAFLREMMGEALTLGGYGDVAQIAARSIEIKPGVRWDG